MDATVDHRDFDLDVYNDVTAAIEAGNVEALRQLIDTRFGINNDTCTFCLYHAVRQANLEMVKMLLDAGVSRVYYYTDIDMDDDEEIAENAEEVQDVMAHVFAHQVAQEARSRLSPLYLASRIEDQELRWKMVKLLVENGVSPKNEHLYSESTLYRAAVNGDCDMVKYLFDAGAEVNCPRDYGRGFPPLHQVLRHLDGEVRVEMVKLLVAIGVDVNAEGPIFQERCVQLIPELENCNRCELMKLLLDAGAQLNYLGGSRQSPLAIAASVNDCELMRFMIAAGADVNLFCNGSMSSPLELALLEYHRDAVQLLLENGANPNIVHEDGKSLLRFAAEFYSENNKEWEYIGILKMLLTHGAKNNCTEKEYRLPFVNVLTSGTLEAMHLFFEHGVTLENCGSPHPLHHAAENERKDILKYFLKNHRYDVDAIYREIDRKFTPLFLAVDQQRIQNIKLLVKWGADVNIPSVYGPENDAESILTSPLFQALDHGNSEIIDLLLSAGANMNVDTNDDFWPRVLEQVLNPQFHKALSSLIGEVTLLKTRGYFSVNNENVLMQKFQDLAPEIEAQCSAELEMLKNIKFYGSLTLYDLLRGKDVTRFVKSDHVADNFKIQKVDDRFPIYGNRIKNCYSLAKSKRKVIDVAIKRLNAILQFYFRNYHEILYIILSHLRLKDLRNLCAV